MHSFGGATRLALNLAKSLAEKGNHVEIWSDNVDLKRTYPVYKKVRVRQIGLLSRVNQRRIRNSYNRVSHATSAFSYIRIPREVRHFDVVNCHNFPSNFVALSQHVVRIPVIWHCNEPSLLLYPLKSDMAWSALLPPQTLLKLYETANRPLTLLDQAAVRRINKITVLSQLISNRVLHLYGRGSSVIRIGVDLQKFNPNLDREKIREKYGIGHRPCILGVAPFRSRIDLVLKALMIVKKTIPDIYLLAVGQGYSLQIERIVKAMSLERNTIFVSNVPDDELPFYYACCDIFVFTQPFWSWSISVVEAMACAKPVIVPSNSGIAEVIEQGINGIKTDLSNTKELSASIKNILIDDDQKKTIGSNARRYTEKFLNEKIFFNKYHQIMENAMSTPH